jgi:hypothetical protein
MTAHLKDSTLFAGHPTRPNAEYHGALDVLCSHRCWRTIALLAEIPVPPQEWALWSGRPSDEQPPQQRAVRRLLVRQGDYPSRASGRYEQGKLVEEDQVYRETKDAAANLRYGRAPRLRRPIPLRSYPQLVTLWGVVWEVAPLPYTVQCSKCDTRHTLPADALESWDLQLSRSDG